MMALRRETDIGKFHSSFGNLASMQIKYGSLLSNFGMLVTACRSPGSCTALPQELREQSGPLAVALARPRASCRHALFTYLSTLLSAQIWIITLVWKVSCAHSLSLPDTQNCIIKVAVNVWIFLFIVPKASGRA